MEAEQDCVSDRLSWSDASAAIVSYGSHSGNVRSELICQSVQYHPHQRGVRCRRTRMGGKKVSKDMESIRLRYKVRYPIVYCRICVCVKLIGLSSALDAGTSITALTIYFLFGVLTQWDGPRWWGNPATDSEHCIAGS
jgi:hypothetical protein